MLTALLIALTAILTFLLGWTLCWRTLSWMLSEMRSQLAEEKNRSAWDKTLQAMVTAMNEQSRAIDKNTLSVNNVVASTFKNKIAVRDVATGEPGARDPFGAPDLLRREREMYEEDEGPKVEGRPLAANESEITARAFGKPT